MIDINDKDIEAIAEAISKAANEASTDIEEYCGPQMALAAARAAIDAIEASGYVIFPLLRRDWL